jgi:hypothetical protein
MAAKNSRRQPGSPTTAIPAVIRIPNFGLPPMISKIDPYGNVGMVRKRTYFKTIYIQILISTSIGKFVYFA